jgi:NAD(P)-dependent dehydrogenase (short-subunit alcohol dehydrogenase family)
MFRLDSEGNMPNLEGVVALVTGASRGVGKGIATALATNGATVHVTGRSLVEGREGRTVQHHVDHAHDAETEAVVAEVIAAEGRLDILVNNAWPGYERMVEGDRYTWEAPLWDQPMWRWDAMFGVGVRAAYCASRPAAKQMAAQPTGGLIVNISFWAAQKFMQNAVYGMSKAAIDKLTADLSMQLREFRITAVSLYPGLVRTESVLANAQFFDMSNSESPEFQGLAVAHLFTDAVRLDKSGKRMTSAELALGYGFTDIDGYQPRPLTLDTA